MTGCYYDYVFEPKEGSMIIFPAHLIHKVENQIQINNINFSISNINSYEKKLRENAAINAKNKAQTYVESLGLKLGNLNYLNEISSPITTPSYEPRMEIAMSADSQYTPSTFIPGDIEISISIQANFEISR